MTPTKFFVDKIATKKWLAENTTFKFPKTGAGPAKYNLIHTMLEGLEDGHWVLKPLKGRVSAGIVLFKKRLHGYKLFGSTEELTLKKFLPVLTEIVVKRATIPKVKIDQGLWFIEEWVTPHVSLAVFTEHLLCPPILRFSGRPEVHFIAICPMLEPATGLAGAEWQDRKYVWLDPTGIVRRAEELPLEGVDEHSIGIVEKKSWSSAPFGCKVLGVPELIDQINREVAPKITLWNNHSWSLDGTFNEDGNFVCIEINYRPGLRFVGFSWEK